MKKYVFDIDGTICSLTDGNYLEAEPWLERIRLINNLYDEGNYIVFQTARGMGSSGNNVEIAKEKWEAITKTQLNNWKVKYHLLFMGKPSGDIYIDDKAISDKNFFCD
jgi:hypothetical protein